MSFYNVANRWVFMRIRQKNVLNVLYWKVVILFWAIRMNNFKLNKQKAFTLVEILIVIGIIGIIALMIIPGLIKESEEVKMQAAFKKAYSTLSQALLSMSRENGDDLSSYTSDFINTFPPEFIKYLGIAEDYGVSSGSPINFPDGYYRSLYRNYSVPGAFFTKEVVLNDGMTVLFRSKGGSSNNDGYAVVSVDVNGHEKPPNVFGRDIFGFEFNGTPIFSRTSSCVVSNDTIHIGMANIVGLSCWKNIMQGINYFDALLIKP